MTHRKEQKRECFCSTHSLPFAMHFPSLCTLNALLTVVSKCVCIPEAQGFVARWISMQLHFKGRGKGGGRRRGFWQEGAGCGICPFALGMVQMGSTVCQPLDCMFWRERKASKLVSFFLFLSSLIFFFYFLSSPSSFPAINCKTNGIVSKSVNAAAVQVWISKSIS